MFIWKGYGLKLCPFFTLQEVVQATTISTTLTPGRSQTTKRVEAHDRGT